MRGNKILIKKWNWVRIFKLFLNCYKSWGLIPPAWLDDTILNLQANGIYFRHVSWVKTLSLSDFSFGIGHFRWYRTFPNIPPPLLATKWHLYFMHVMDHTHRWFELVLLCTVCCAPTSVPLVLIELESIAIYYVSERNCSFLTLNLLTELTALKIWRWASANIY
jgi:hypothetical protein